MSSSRSTPLSLEVLSVIRLISNFILPQVYGTPRSDLISFDCEIDDSPAKTITVIHDSVSNVEESPYYYWLNVDIRQLAASKASSSTVSLPLVRVSNPVSVSLPVVRVSNPGTVCPICLVECEVDAEVNEMPCKHRFCGGCIGKWLQINQSCPVCRFHLMFDNDENNMVWKIVLYVGENVIDPDRTEIVVDPLNPDWIGVYFD